MFNMYSKAKRVGKKYY